jgi:hypothetical protein
MESAHGWRSESALALAVTLLANAGLFWGLSRMMQPRVPEIVADKALEVIWIARTSPRPAASAASAPRPVAASTSRPPRSVTAHTESTKPTASETAALDAARSMSALYLMQARQAEAETGVPGVRDPLADRQARLPGEGSARFRMKSQTSVASVVSAVGGLFGARDPDEPCREHRRNIGDLALDGDGAALQDQIEYERRFCRP